MSRKRRIFIWIAAVVLVLTVLIPLLININFINNFVRSNIQKNIAHAINGECTIERLRMSISEMKIYGLKAENNAFCLDINSLNAGISLYSLFLGRLMVNFMDADTINMEIYKNSPAVMKKDTTSHALSIKYSYPFSNIRIRIDVSSASVNCANIIYDTLVIKDISLNASLSLNKERTALFYRLNSGRLHTYTKIEPCDGEIVLNNTNAVGNGTLNTSHIEISYNASMHDSTLNLNDIKLKLMKKDIEAGGHRISAFSDVNISGMLRGSERYLSADLSARSIAFDTLSLESLNAKITLSGDTLSAERIEIKDSLLYIVLTGITEISSFPESELTLNIEYANLSHIFRNISFEPHNVSGNIFAKITDFNNYSVVLSELKGFYGNDSLMELRGTAAYIDSSIYLNGIVCNINYGMLELNGSIGSKGLMNAAFMDFPVGIVNRFTDGNEIFGNISGDITLSGNIDDYKMEYFLNLDNMAFRKSNAEHINISGELSGRRKLLLDMLATFKAVNGSVQGSDFSIIYGEAAKHDSMLYSELYVLMDEVYGEYQGEFVTNDSLNMLRGNISNLKLRTDIEQINMEKPAYLDLSHEGIKISGLDLRSRTVDVQFDMEYNKKNFDLKCRLRDDSLLFTNLFTGLLIEGSVDAYIEGKGTIENPNMYADIVVRNFNFEGAKIDSALFKAEYADSIIDVTGFNMFYRGSHSRAEGRILVRDLADWTVNTMDARAYVEGVDSTFFAPLFDIFTLDSKGYADGYVEASGSVLNPELQGYVNIHNGFVHIVPLGTDISNINGSFTVNGHDITIDTVAGVTSKGKVTVKGGIELKHYNLTHFDFNILAKGAEIEGIDYIYAVGDCSLRIDGRVTRPRITGNVYATEALSNIPFMNMASTVPSTRIDSTYIDILITGDKDIWVKNSFVDVEMAGSVRIKKDVSRINITGMANVIRGYYFYLDKRFTVTEGTFRLLDTDRVVEPTFNVASYTRANYTDKGENSEAVIYLNVSGPVDRPEISMYSEPAMSIDNIISILSFNTTVAGMNEITNISKTLPEKALQIYLRNKYLNALSSSIGIDQLNIETALLSQNRSAKLSIGKYIGRNFFISYTHDIFSFSRDVFKIEYNFTDNGEFVTERDENGELNAGVQFKLRY